MKTSVCLDSSSRELLGKNIPVMSKDGFVCITDVMEVLNDKRKMLGLSPKRIEDVLRTKTFQERLPALIKELNSNVISDSDFSALKNSSEGIGSINDLRKFNMAYRRGSRECKKWFINPYIFVMIALELDPEIYAKVIVWLTDGLIQDRNLAGEAYIRLSKAVSGLVDDPAEFKDKIQRVAKGINYVVFNEHEDNRRNRASHNEMIEIVSLENSITSLIEDGFVKSFDEVINFLGKKWKKRWGNPVEKLAK